MKKVFYAFLVLFVICAMSTAVFAADSEYKIWVKGEKSLAVLHTVTLEELESGIIDVGELPGGDANNDNRVSLSDFIIYSANYGQDVPLIPVPGRPGEFMRDPNHKAWKADFNNDGKVSLSDFIIYSASYGKPAAIEPK